MRAFLRERLFTADPRTLGLFRVVFGLLLLINLYDRINGLNLVSFYTNDGFWPNHYALFLPPTHGFWSLLLGFSTAGELRVVFALIAVVYVLYLVGWRTRLMQVLALVCLESVNLRFLLPQHGGNVVMNILAVWSLFWPLGERYSLDALFKSLKHFDERTPGGLEARGWKQALRTEPVVSPALFFIAFNFAAIYFFNALHKEGSAWRDGTAIHWLLWQHRINTQVAWWLRYHEPGFLSPLLSYGTLVVEWALPAMILSPVGQRWVRPLAIASIIGLHGGISLLCTLGPFSYGMMTFSMVLLPAWVWDALEQRQRTGPTHLVKYDAASALHRFGARVAARLDTAERLRFQDVAGARLSASDVVAMLAVVPGWRWVRWVLVVPVVGPATMWALRQAAALGAQTLEPRRARPPIPAFERAGRWVGLVAPCVIFYAVLSQLLFENWGVPPSIRLTERPPGVVDIVDYLQIPQGWSMFAPDIARNDGRLVVDARLADGTHVDVLTGEPPDWEAPLHGPWNLNHDWGECHGRMPGWKHHWRNFTDYLKRRPALMGWPESRRVESVEVWRVWADAPPPGETVISEVHRDKLFGD